MKLQPLHDFVIIKKAPAATQTQSGIVLVSSKPDSATEIGTILAVGPGTHIDGRFDPMILKVGDSVMFNKNSGQEIEFEKVKYTMLKQRDVMGVIPK